MSTYQAQQIARLELASRAKDRLIAQLMGRVADLEQANRVSQTGAMGGGGDGGGGVYYADPGSTVVASDGEADLDVTEILLAGDEPVGPRTVLNRWPDDTWADGRLFLGRTRDGGYAIIGQACATGGG